MFLVVEKFYTLLKNFTDDLIDEDDIVIPMVLVDETSKTLCWVNWTVGGTPVSNADRFCGTAPAMSPIPRGLRAD